MDIKILNYTEDYIDLLYLAGRGCYGLVDIANEIPYTKLSRKQLFIKNLIKNKHKSVLEHASISILIENCSRSFMSQITRHRHASFSVKSQHYVNHENFGYKKLEIDNPMIVAQYEDLMQVIDDTYISFIEDGVPKHVAREILPNACLTNIFMTANFREWRYIIKLRSSSFNTYEMQEFGKIIKIKFRELIPGVFDDL